MDWQPVIERYENELTRNVIPFWVKNCVDREYGGYFTMLDRDGSVYDTTKYMWMQWRIVYMFAELYRRRCGEGHPEYLEIARQGFDFLFEHGRTGDGSYYFALNREGVPAMAPYRTGRDTASKIAVRSGTGTKPAPPCGATSGGWITRRGAGTSCCPELRRAFRSVPS